jgi:hypothetical protein
MLGIGIFFTIINSIFLDRYWYFYDFGEIFFIQTIIFQLVIIPSGFVIGLIIIKRVKLPKSQWYLSVMLSIILVTASCLTYVIVDSMPVDRIDHEYRYELVLNTSTDNSFILYAPMLTDHTHNYDIPNSFDFIGNGEISTFISEYGLALKADCVGSFSINYLYEGREHFGWTHNLEIHNINLGRTYRDYGCYIYYNSTSAQNASISIDWEYIGLGSEESIHLSGILNVTGWQFIPGTTENVQIA